MAGRKGLWVCDDPWVWCPRGVGPGQGRTVEPKSVDMGSSEVSGDPPLVRGLGEGHSRLRPTVHSPSYHGSRPPRRPHDFSSAGPARYPRWNRLRD